MSERTAEITTLAKYTHSLAHAEPFATGTKMCIEKCLRSIEFNKSISKLMCVTVVAATAAVASELSYDIYHTFANVAQH